MRRCLGLPIPLLTVFCFSAALAQQQPAPAANPSAPAAQATPPGPEDAPAPPSGGVRQQEPLTEEQIRQQRIRALDPLDKGDPAAVPATAAPAGAARQDATPILPGSVAEGNRRAPGVSGPAVISDQNTPADTEEYTGPAVLSRTYTISRPMAPRAIRWTPTLSVSEEYRTGLTGNTLLPGGVLQNVNAPGTRLGWGLTGRHMWRRDELGLEYRGDGSRYASSSAYNGTNHNLTLDYKHAFSKRLALNITEVASSFSQSYTLQNPALGFESSLANLNLAASPTVQIMDAGFRQASTSVSMVWQKSTRLSFNVNGSYFGVQRTGQGLFGNTGYTSTADVNYRYTRKLTLGAYYAFTDYVFSHRIQVADAHTVGLIYSYAFSRTFQFRLRVGATRLESQGLTTVTIDPAIAQLLGQTTGIVNAYSRHTISDISSELARDFGRRNTAKLSYARGLSPGNGLQLTSTQQSFTGGLVRRISTRDSLDIGGGQTSLSSSGQSVGQYMSRFLSINFVHRYPRGLANDFGFAYRTFDITEAPVNHAQLSVSAGLSWSPGENGIHF